MIPRAYITSWRKSAPWVPDFQVEQDLVISRALVELFSIAEWGDSMAFRGGTALYKLYLQPPARYSEDIDLVQTRPGPIGNTLNLARKVLDPWLGTPRRQFKEGRVNLVYHFDSQDQPPFKLRLKIEINTREHFSILGFVRRNFDLRNPWFSGTVGINTYWLEELLGTKLRALYQRKKGRDLFDLWYAMQAARVDTKRLLECFHGYIRKEGLVISRANFEENLAIKCRQPDFRNDLRPLLRSGISWDFDAAMDMVMGALISKLPGSSWQGRLC